MPCGVYRCVCCERGRSGPPSGRTLADGAGGEADAETAAVTGGVAGDGGGGATLTAAGATLTGGGGATLTSGGVTAEGGGAAATPTFSPRVWRPTIAPMRTASASPAPTGA